MKIKAQKFPIEVIVSLTTGFVLCEFGKMYELAKHVLGYPIWTHEFADRSMLDRIRDAIYEQHPQLRSFVVDGCDRSNCHEYVERARQQFGAELAIDYGSESRTESPIESLKRIAPNATIINTVVE